MLLLEVVGSKAVAIATFYIVLKNSNDHIALVRHVMESGVVFGFNVPMMSWTFTLFYMGFVCCLWAYCYKNLKVFRGNELAMSKALDQERAFFARNGIWLLT